MRLRVWASSSAEGLVHEQDAGLERQSPGYGYALLHPTRELERVVAGEVEQPHDVEEAPGLVGALLFREVAQAELDVLLRREPGVERVLLEDHAPVLARGQKGGAVQCELSGRGGLEAGDDTQEGRLATSGGTDDGNELAVLQGQVDVVKSLDRALAATESLLHPFQHERGRHG